MNNLNFSGKQFDSMRAYQGSSVELVTDENGTTELRFETCYQHLTFTVTAKFLALLAEVMLEAGGDEDKYQFEGKTFDIFSQDRKDAVELATNEDGVDELTLISRSQHINLFVTVDHLEMLMEVILEAGEDTD